MMPSKPSLAFLALLVCSVAGCAAGPSGWNSGCGANREAAIAPPLQGTEWVVEDIDGAGVVERSRPTLIFATDGGVSGNASCNTFRATYAVDGASLAISRAITTRMACAPALMQQETRFLGVLTGARTVDVSRDGTLTLRSSDGASIRARRAPGAGKEPR